MKAQQVGSSPLGGFPSQKQRPQWVLFSLYLSSVFSEKKLWVPLIPAFFYTSSLQRILHQSAPLFEQFASSLPHGSSDRAVQMVCLFHDLSILPLFNSTFLHAQHIDLDGFTTRRTCQKRPPFCIAMEKMLVFPGLVPRCLFSSWMSAPSWKREKRAAVQRWKTKENKCNL